MFLSFWGALRKVRRGLAGLSIIVCHSAVVASQVRLNRKKIAPTVTKMDVLTNTGPQNVGRSVSHGEARVASVIGQRFLFVEVQKILWAWTFLFHAKSFLLIIFFFFSLQPYSRLYVCIDIFNAPNQQVLITLQASSFCSLAQTGLPSVGEAVPQALAVTPEQPVKDAVKEPVQVEAFQVLLPPDPLQRRVHVGPHNIQHLSDGERQRGDVGRIKKKQEV